jgi:hypothetical protein
LRISSEQVQAALQYIDEHKQEVMSSYQKILDRCARGNPPGLQAKLDATHAKYQALWAKRQRNGVLGEAKNEGDPGRQ